MGKLKNLSELFTTFAKIGMFTFGGGYAMIALLQREIADKNKWATEEELMDYFAIAQCTPGVIAVNTATFIGAKREGVAGGIAATLGLVFPSIVIITVIAAFITHFLEYSIVQHILGGIRVAVTVLIINSVVTMSKKSVTDIVCLSIAVISFLLSLIFSLSPVYIVVAAAALGLILRRGGEKN